MNNIKDVTIEGRIKFDVPHDFFDYMNESKKIGKKINERVQ